MFNKNRLNIKANQDIIIAIGILFIVLMMIIPMPALMLDIL